MSTRQQNQLIESTYYDVLGLTPSATDTEIKQAYRRLVMMWHPDTQENNSAIAEQNFKIINEAYSKLKTRAARDQYNQILRLQKKAGSIPRHSQKTIWGSFWNWLSMLESNKK